MNVGFPKGFFASTPSQPPVHELAVTEGRLLGEIGMSCWTKEEINLAQPEAVDLSEW